MTTKVSIILKSKFSLFLYLCSFLCSCAGNRTAVENQILLAVPDKATTSQIFLNNFELEFIVPINDNDGFFLSSHFNIQNVILRKNKLIILDRYEGIFVIDANTGKVETQIKRSGNGPGEWHSLGPQTDLTDLAFDDDREQIIVFAFMTRRLLYFGLDGSFLKEERLNDNFDNMVYDNGKLIFYKQSAPDRNGRYYYLVNVYDLNDKSWKKVGDDDRIVNFRLGFGGREIVKSKNIWFTPKLDFGLYKFSGDEIEVPYQLDIPQRMTDDMKARIQSNVPGPNYDMSVFNEIRERNILYGIASIRETEKFIIFTSNRGGIMMFDKNNSNLYQEERWIEAEYLGLKLSYYFPHDGDDNRIMFIVTSDQWAERSPKNDEKIPVHLREKINSIKINKDVERNHILIFYKEK